jgi:hypothetical protein
VVFTVTWEINLSEVSVQGFWDTYACYGYNKELLCTRARTKAKNKAPTIPSNPENILLEL